MGASNAIYTPQPRIYYAQLTDGLDVNYPVSRRLVTHSPFRHTDRIGQNNVQFFDFNNDGLGVRLAPWQREGVGDVELNGALSWDGQYKRWIWCENLGTATPVWESHELFADEPRSLAGNILQSSTRHVFLIGRVNQPTSVGAPRQRLIWVEKWLPGAGATSANEHAFAADLDGSNQIQIAQFSQPFRVDGLFQTFRTIDAWCFDQETGDVYYVTRETQVNNVGVTLLESSRLQCQRWDTGQQKYGSILPLYTVTWTGSTSESRVLFGQPFLSRSLDNAILLPAYTILTDATPGHFGTFRDWNRILMIGQSGAIVGEIELPNPHVVIPDEFDSDFDETLPDGKTVIAWTSEITQRMYVNIFPTGQPRSVDSFDGIYQMGLDGSGMEKMIIDPAVGLDAGSQNGIPLDQMMFLGPGCHGAWECCT